MILGGKSSLISEAPAEETEQNVKFLKAYLGKHECATLAHENPI